jgi:hypothetical protein
MTRPDLAVLVMRYLRKYDVPQQPIGVHPGEIAAALERQQRDVELVLDHLVDIGRVTMRYGSWSGASYYSVKH